MTLTFSSADIASYKSLKSRTVFKALKKISYKCKHTLHLIQWMSSWCLCWCSRDLYSTETAAQAVTGFTPFLFRWEKSLHTPTGVFTFVLRWRFIAHILFTQSSENTAEFKLVGPVWIPLWFHRIKDRPREGAPDSTSKFVLYFEIKFTIFLFM